MSGHSIAWHTVLTSFYTCILGPSYQALLQPGIILYDLDFSSYARFLESRCETLLMTGSYIDVNRITMKDDLFNLIFYFFEDL